MKLAHFVSLFILLLAGSLHAYQNVDPRQLLDLLTTNDSTVLVDVREVSEYDAGHIEGALLYPWNSGLFADQYTELPVDYPLALYCGSGFRSSQAAAFLDTAANAVYKDKVYSLTGGINGWPYGVVTGGQDGPAVIIEPDLLHFGESVAGSANKLKPFTLINSSSRGTAVLLVSALETGGYSLAADTVILHPGDSLPVDVAFNPTETAHYIDSVLVLHGGIGRDTMTVILDGNGVQALTGDIDSSGAVDIFDLLELLNELSGKSGGGELERVDLNNDGVLDIFDLLSLLFLLRENS
jgi:rhodanese-related sulfurtransferase